MKYQVNQQPTYIILKQEEWEAVKKKDNINNLIALTREEHIQFGDKKQFKEYLQGIHNKKIIEKLKTL